MLKPLLLLTLLSGLQAVPLAVPRRLQVSSSSAHRLPDGFRQGTESSGRINAGLVQRQVESREAFVPSLGNGHGEMQRRQLLTHKVPADVPVQRNGGGWVRSEEPSAARLPEGFRQGTEPIRSIPDGFKQGTEPMRSIPDGFRQGTEPIKSIPDGFKQGTEPMRSIPDGFRQGTEPIRSIPDGFRHGTEPMKSIPDGFRQGTEPLKSISAGFRQGTEPIKSIPAGFKQGTEPMRSIPDGFRQGTEPMKSIPDGFRQGTEPLKSIPAGFRQGTEPIKSIPAGFKQGTEPMKSIPDGFRQGTEPLKSIPAGFRQGTEPIKSIPAGFKQGTEPMKSIPDGFRQGTEPIKSIPAGFRQGTEPSASRIQTHAVACKGEVIDGNCYEFNPTPLAFRAAQASCRALAPNAELASVTNGDLHSRLVAMVTKGGQSGPVLTWLGATVKKQQGLWVDGSEWRYSDWMPGHPNIHTDKPACVEMFKMDESWWTAADCDLERASICSYRVSA